jgi:hypothetical protein
VTLVDWAELVVVVDVVVTGELEVIAEVR